MPSLLLTESSWQVQKEPNSELEAKANGIHKDTSAVRARLGRILMAAKSPEQRAAAAELEVKNADMLELQSMLLESPKNQRILRGALKQEIAVLEAGIQNLSTTLHTELPDQTEAIKKRQGVLNQIDRTWSVELVVVARC